MTDILLTLPAHNEADRLERALRLVSQSLNETGWSYKILVAEDGSADNTREVLQSVAKRMPSLVYRSEPARLGRGLALRQAWRDFPASVYVYADIDFPAGVDGVLAVTKRVLHGADVAVGSRYAPGATVVRPPLVKFASKGYNLLIRVLFSDGITDHQCGIKALTRHALEMTALQARSDSWFWDTELTILARRLGLRVEEVPLTWRESRYERTSVARLAREVPYFLGEIIRFSGTLDQVLERNAQLRRAGAVSSPNVVYAEGESGQSRTIAGSR